MHHVKKKSESGNDSLSNFQSFFFVLFILYFSKVSQSQLVKIFKDFDAPAPTELSREFC
ncbi:hypothetical protein BT96DRAFT_331783 [Gymnopus androsaceus JB14]|uniref:Uncharacterized protein n=1 Tax=Gymnopus androsaceus JB14 TaxID=1447944 RepID=A0A6A4GZH8_9AGAR|nr:hypothetical protein BT96DRAFT_331783 [Gymnopus androsaceus JB14]